jgi:hypothetical protein
LALQEEKSVSEEKETVILQMAVGQDINPLFLR